MRFLCLLIRDCAQWVPEEPSIGDRYTGIVKTVLAAEHNEYGDEDN